MSIRLRPLAWYGHISLRFELYGRNAGKQSCNDPKPVPLRRFLHGTRNFQRVDYTAGGAHTQKLLSSLILESTFFLVELFLDFPFVSLIYGFVKKLAISKFALTLRCNASCFKRFVSCYNIRIRSFVWSYTHQRDKYVYINICLIIYIMSWVHEHYLSSSGIIQLVAQLVEHFTGIVEVTPFQAWNFLSRVTG